MKQFGLYETNTRNRAGIRWAPFNLQARVVLWHLLYKLSHQASCHSVHRYMKLTDTLFNAYRVKTRLYT